MIVICDCQCEKCLDLETFVKKAGYKCHDAGHPQCCGRLQSGLNTHEKPPTTNKHEPVWEAVIRDIKSAAIDPHIDALLVEDIRERDRIGEKKYGTRIQPLNGRDAIVDAYQEALGLVVYLRQRLLELPLLGAVSDMLLENVYRDSLSIVRRLRTSLLWRD